MDFMEHHHFSLYRNSVCGAYNMNSESFTIINNNHGKLGICLAKTSANISILEENNNYHMIEILTCKLICVEKWGIN